MVVVFLSDLQAVDQVVFDPCQAHILNRMMLSINHKRNAFKTFLQQLFAGRQNIIANMLDHMLTHSCAQLQHEEYVRLSHQQRHHFLTKTCCGLDEVVIIDRTDCNTEV